MSWRAALTLAAVLACCMQAQAQGQPAKDAYTPAQAAYLKGEIRKAQQRFVATASAISGVPQSKIKEWMATDGRDVPPKVNIIPALQRERGKPLSEEERAAILAADQERYETIEAAKRDAARK